MSTSRSFLLVICSGAVGALIACTAAPPGELDASATDGRIVGPRDGSVDAGVGLDAGPFDSGPIEALAITAPTSGADVYESVLVRAVAPGGTSSVQFFVDPESTARCDDTELPFRCLVHLDPAGAAGPVTLVARAMVGGVPAEARVTVMRRAITSDTCTDPLAACIARWVTEGTAAGFAGLTYENRDGMHALLDTSAMPGITALTNDESVDSWAMSGPSADPSTILIANVSKAYTTISASLLRYQVAWGSGYSRFETAFLNDKLFFYPEHVDCGVEDFYSFMTAAAFTSQGSSGSELDEVSKHLYALAAFAPSVRARLHSERMLMSVLTMLHRRTRVASDAEYLSGVANPTAFGNFDNDVAMTLAAHAIGDGATPPIGAITVSDDTSPMQIGDGLMMRARAFATTGSDEYSLTVDASSSRDLDGRQLTYHWRVIRGDPSYVAIAPQNDDESVVRITFRRHPETTYESDGGAASSRVTRRSSLMAIGLFVHNGVYFSSPVFVTSYSLDPRRGATGDNNLD